MIHYKVFDKDSDTLLEDIDNLDHGERFLIKNVDRYKEAKPLHTLLSSLDLDGNPSDFSKYKYKGIIWEDCMAYSDDPEITIKGRRWKTTSY